MLVAAERKSRSTIHVIRRDQLNREMLQTSGSQRLSAISAAQGIASALGAAISSMQTKIPGELWTKLKAQKFIEQNAPIPA